MAFDVFVMHRDLLLAQALGNVVSCFSEFCLRGFDNEPKVPDGCVGVSLFLVDTHLLTSTSFRLVQQLREVYPRCRVIALGNPRLAHALQHKGCWSLVDTQCSISDLELLMGTCAHATEPFVYPVRDSVERSETPLQLLAPRELETLELLAKGLKKMEIAREMGVKSQTVSSNIARIKEKLGIYKDYELIFWKLRRDELRLAAEPNV